MSHVDHGWRHAPKAAGGTDPIPGVGGGGIQFDTDNVGGYLHIETDGTPAVGNGIELIDSGGSGLLIRDGDGTALSGGGLTIRSNGGGLTVDGQSGGVLITDPAGGININSNGGGVVIQDGAGGNVNIVSSGAGLLLTCTGADIVATIITGGQSFYVQDGSGNRLFQVDENGDLHGATGKALVFDL